VSVLVIVQGTPNSDKLDTLKQYQRVAGAVIQKHGGQVVVRGNGTESLAGHHQWSLGIVLRFPDIAAVHAWHSDPDYEKVIPLRNEAYAQLEINVFQE
jgi:uncharacterized protein (DUF1330 family)